jgi:hypothetical protein
MITDYTMLLMIKVFWDMILCHLLSKSKVCPTTGHKGPERVRGIALLSLTSALDQGGRLTPRPGRITLKQETRYP